MRVDDKVEAVRNAVINNDVLVTGTCIAPNDAFILAYRKDSVSPWNRIDLKEAKADELSRLLQACEPAKFGRNDADVLDESYRKAWKLDKENFISRFNLECSGILDTICSKLIKGRQQSNIQAELYKLNIYGEGGFFKAHKDTPRGDKMFGSLVIAFPTPHVGGALVLRHQGSEWTFDSAVELRDRSSPSFGFAAFYSDIEHEVLPVSSGHRVTLTYNLYWGSAPSAHNPDSILATTPQTRAVKARLTALLSDPSFLPEGGVLGFGLQHRYPINDSTTTRDILKRLKGSDAIVLEACEELHLKPELNLLYDTDHSVYMCPSIVDLSDNGEIEDVEEHLRNAGHLIETTHRRVEVKTEVHWITERTSRNKAWTDYIAYGNEASMETLYGEVCLVATVHGRWKRHDATKRSHESDNEDAEDMPARKKLKSPEA